MGFFDWLGGDKNKFHAEAYDPNASSFQIQNGYGDSLGKALAGAQGRATPTASAATVGPMQTASDSAFRGDQQGLVGALQRRASGQAPSAAELQLNKGLDAQISAQRAQAASARGVSPGLAARLAANNIAGAQQATNADAAIMRANEQAQAEQSLGQVLSGARGQDVGLSTFNAGQANQGTLTQAGFDQQAGLANQSAELQNRAQMDSATQAYIGMGMSREEATQRAAADLEKLRADQSLGVQQINSGVASQNAARSGAGRQAVVGGLFSLGGSALAGGLARK